MRRLAARTASAVGSGSSGDAPLAAATTTDAASSKTEPDTACERARSVSVVFFSAGGGRTERSALSLASSTSARAFAAAPFSSSSSRFASFADAMASRARSTVFSKHASAASPRERAHAGVSLHDGVEERRRARVGDAAGGVRAEELRERVGELLELGLLALQRVVLELEVRGGLRERRRGRPVRRATSRAPSATAESPPE